MSTPLTGSTALVVGANGGIGRAIALALGTAGARLVLAARDRTRLEHLRSELESRGIEGRVHPADVTDDEEVRDLVDAAASDCMDIAVNNAGAAHRPARLHELPLADIDRVLDVTLRGTVIAMRHELAVLPDGGSIVNIASAAGLASAPRMAAYVAAKHAVVGLTRTVAVDEADRGIRINAVAPGPIDPGGVAARSDEVARRIASAIPLGRVGHPDEVGAAVAWLASPEAAYITGAILPIDGGKTARGA